MDTTWLTRMAIMGLAIVGLMSVAIAPSPAPLGAALLGGSFIGFESITTQILLVGILVTVLAVGLADRSRLAYIIASIELAVSTDEALRRTDLVRVERVESIHASRDL